MVFQHLTHNVGGADPTLHLPRILCLHGGGTNARIFRMQCRVIRASLCKHFRLVFAQGPFPASPGPDVTAMYEKHGPFRGWLRSTAEDVDLSAAEVVAQIQDALNMAICADDLQGATGEIVGLLGFSQGAKMAASMLYAQQMCRRLLGPDAKVWPDFRFAVLLAGRAPLVWLFPEMAMPPALVSAGQPATSIPVDESVAHHDLLRVPTIHIHGLNDAGLELHRRLLKRYCHPGSASLLEWQGEHRIPIRTADVNRVVEQILKVARETKVLEQWTWVEEVKRLESQSACRSRLERPVP